jgi:uncharacterized membrane protein YgcG
VPAGDVFDAEQRSAVGRALELAGRATGLTFSLRVGPAEGSARAHALRLHAERGASAPDTVLIFVDPGRRSLEIVTGSRARRRIDDAVCRRAADVMTPSFAAGDLAGGVVAGLAVLGERAPQGRPTGRKTKAAAKADEPPTLF